MTVTVQREVAALGRGASRQQNTPPPPMMTAEEQEPAWWAVLSRGVLRMLLRAVCCGTSLYSPRDERRRVTRRISRRCTSSSPL